MNELQVFTSPEFGQVRTVTIEEEPWFVGKDVAVALGYEWLIHSWDYGVELHNLIGKDVEYCIPEIERRVREALLQDDRITAVQNFEFTVNKKKVLTTFTVVSIFGEINTEMGVEI